jgi:cell division septation protein DedD
LEDRVRERLTGAAILVTLVVLLVPELFRGERGVPLVVRAAPDGAPPLRSYTIELGAAPQGNSVQSATVQGATAAPKVEAPVVEPDVSASAAVAPASAAGSAPVVASEPRVAVKPAVADAAGSGWIVQLGSFSKRENASRLVQQAAKKGMRLSVAGPDSRGLFRVRSAPQADRGAAVALQARLRTQGFAGVVSASQ